MGLLAFSALSIDLGSLWVARAQAQNAADAGALAGGVALAYGNPADTDAAAGSGAGRRSAARDLGRAGRAGLRARMTRRGLSGRLACGRRRLRRRGRRTQRCDGAPLPVFFSRLFGVGATTLRASASAQGDARQLDDVSAPVGDRRSLDRGGRRPGCPTTAIRLTIRWYVDAAHPAPATRTRRPATDVGPRRHRGLAGTQRLRSPRDRRQRVLDARHAERRDGSRASATSRTSRTAIRSRCRSATACR